MTEPSPTLDLARPRPAVQRGTELRLRIRVELFEAPQMLTVPRSWTLLEVAVEVAPTMAEFVYAASPPGPLTLRHITLTSDVDTPRGVLTAPLSVSPQFVDIDGTFGWLSLAKQLADDRAATIDVSQL